ncbi:hypothetical protein BFW01_g11645 [Lasiodiplodia theobromae]|nr:hypothetical protein BFW01_g11645 [Lasiodiplodia theobromae]
MQRYTIEEHESGYIEEKDLENFLKMQFGANRNYDIKVCKSASPSSSQATNTSADGLRQKNDEANYVYWSYTAPRALNKDEIQIIRGVDE